MVYMFFGSDQGPDETHPAESMITPWIEQLQYDRESWTPGWVRDLFRSQPSEQFLEELTNTVLQMPTNSAVTLLASQLLIEERNFQNHLAGLDMPTMFIASDAPWAVSEAEMIRESFPDIRVEVIQHTGHALFVDEPELFNRILENFILSMNELCWQPKGQSIQISELMKFLAA